MLTIIYRQPNTPNLMQIEWKVGQSSPFKGSPNLVYTTGEVIASGNELEWIKVNFTNMPISNTPVTHFYGDFAKIIVGNLL